MGGSLELALLSYRAMQNAIQEMLQTPEESEQRKADKKEAEKKEQEKSSEKWIVSQRKYGSDSGFIWVEDDTLILPDKIPAQQAPSQAAPAATPQAAPAATPQEAPAQQPHQISAQEAAKALQESQDTNSSQATPNQAITDQSQTNQEVGYDQETRTQSLQPTMIGQSGRKRTPEEILQTLVKHKIATQPSLQKEPVQRARDQKSSGSGLSVQMLQREFSAFTAQRQKQEAMMLVPKGNDNFSSKSMYVEELPPEQQIRMDSYMRRMVWTMDNINKSLPMLRAPEEQGLNKLTVLISLQLDRKGNVMNLELKKSCGYKEFDERALFVFQEAKNFGDLPNFYTPPTCTQHWGFSFIPQVVSQGYANKRH